MKHYSIRIAITALCMAIAGSAAAQRFDATATAGLNMCQIDGDGAGRYNHPGLRAGVGTSFSLGSDEQSPWRMVVELAFTNKGSYNKDFNTTLSVSYIEIPLLLSLVTLRAEYWNRASMPRWSVKR